MAGIRGLHSVTLFVKDLERASAFYTETLGFVAETRYARSQLLRAGGLRLLLHVGGGAAAAEPAALHLHLAVDDIDGFHELLRARGAAPSGPPETKPWGLRSFELRDPSGHLWEFVQETGGGAQAARTRYATNSE